MSVLLLSVYLSRHGVNALPISAVVDNETVPSSTCNDLDSCRTLSDIILWSCLVTVLSCTWVSIHPNLPGPNEGSFRIGMRRAGMMLLGLIAPELIILLAARQWISARAIADKYKDRGWTQTHGFFALMGGFMLYQGKTPLQTLLPNGYNCELKTNLKHGRILITEKQIEDRSKGDPLSKGFVLLQTSWFVLQCIARGVQHLPVTELELVTLAFAALNLVIYGLWWKKPLNVSCPLPVYTVVDTTGLPAPEPESEVHQTLGACNEQGRNETGVHEKGRFRDRFRCNPMKLIWSALKEALLKVFIFMITGIGDIAEEQRVHTFYSCTRYCGEMYGSIAIITTVVTLVFGAIHCVAWFFQFPTHTEQSLWRLSSCLIIVIPVLVLLVYLRFIDRWEIRDGGDIIPFASAIAVFMRLFLLPPVILYIAARVTLLILPLISLRRLPAGAYQTVRWTTFILHI